jgi:biopolymer transport protein TolR
VDLPKADAKSIGQQDNAPIEIALDSKGNIFIGETKVTQDRMKTMLEAIAAESTDKRVYIKADKDIDYGTVMQVTAIVNNAGFNKIAFVTDASAGGGK